MPDITITLYNNTDKTLVADKSPATIASYTGTFREAIDFINPRIVIEASAFDVQSSNYFSIPGAIDRYFYLTGKKALNDKLWEITGHADLRKTFRTQLLAAEGIVARNENNYDMYLNDPQIPVGARKTLSIRKFPNDTPFTNGSGGSVSLVVLGGA